VQLSADIVLAQTGNELRVEGESQIPQSTGRIRRVWLEPNNPPAFPQAIQALLNADLIVIGPGSLYTSLLPNLLVPDLADAIRASRGLKIFVGNIATQRGETDCFTLEDHVHVIDEHVGSRLFDVVVVNNNFKPALPKNVDYVPYDPEERSTGRVVKADLVDEFHPWRHDSRKLSQIIMLLYQEKAGPLVE